MLDKTVTLPTLISTADLEETLPKHVVHAADGIEVTKNYMELETHRVFYLQVQPDEGRIRGNVLFIHDQTNSSSIWIEQNTMQTFAACGYNCIAIDLPSMGRTGGQAVEEARRPQFLCAFIDAIGLRDVVLVGSSMAGQYIIPLLMDRPRGFFIVSVIAIALSDTNKIPEDVAQHISTPCLVLRGALDTSIGSNAVDHLKRLPNAKVIIVPNGRHLCHRSNPEFFHRVAVNFLEVVLDKFVRPAIVSMV